MPGFRARNEGEPVRVGDSIILQSAKAPSMYVHCDTEQNLQKPFKTPEDVKQMGEGERIDDDVRTNSLIHRPSRHPQAG